MKGCLKTEEKIAIIVQSTLVVLADYVTEVNKTQKKLRLSAWLV